MVSVLGRHAILVRVHQRGRGEGRHRGLAHREQVRPLAGALADQLEELDQIIDVIVEVEACRPRAAPASRRASR